MMTTPICDFVKEYIDKRTVRLHMPGHKGKSILCFEKYDITEIGGADVLYHADGIIKESEENASALFETAKTIYSTEGSSLCIRAMLYLVKMYAVSKGVKPTVLAARNTHKTFVTAAAVLDIDVDWIYSVAGGVVSCEIDISELEEKLSQNRPVAMYVTSPDYLGNIADISAISSLCRKYGCLLLVDNAHGAYLKFLDGLKHPIDLGADICCDSAHKTLPALTGGAYLHIARSAPKLLCERAEGAMSIFASTSPSYLILQSLDKLNRILADGYEKKLEECIKTVDDVKKDIAAMGYTLVGDEPLKLTIACKGYGYTGKELAGILEKEGVVCEFSDPDFVVMMFTPQTSNDEFIRLLDLLFSIPPKRRIEIVAPILEKAEVAMKPSKAMLEISEEIAVEDASGRILAEAQVACPPAIPIVICGERIDESAIKCFEYYGIDTCCVVVEGQEDK